MKYLAIGGAYFVTLIGLNTLSIFFSEKIKNQEELDKIIIEESKKLRLNKKAIGIYLPKFEAECKKIGNHYIVKLGGKMANRGCVKHELYHIFRGHLENQSTKKVENLKYFFKQEPQAIAYDVFGLKL